MLSDLPKRIGPVDIIVNNFETNDCSKAKADGNFMSQTALIAAYGPVMKQRGCGHIVNLYSSEPCVDTSNQAALKALALSTQKDFMNTRVRITAININSLPVEEVYPEPMPPDPQDIADQILFAVTRPHPVQNFTNSGGTRRTNMVENTSQGHNTVSSSRNSESEHAYWQEAQQSGRSCKNSHGWVPGNGYSIKSNRRNQDDGYDGPYDQLQNQWQRDGNNLRQHDQIQNQQQLEWSKVTPPPVYTVDDYLKKNGCSPSHPASKITHKSQIISMESSPMSTIHHMDQAMSHPFAMDATPPHSPSRVYSVHGHHEFIPGQVYQA